MARTKQTPRKFPARFNPKEWNCIQRTPAFPFSILNQGTPEIIRKYYPKRSRFFWKGLLHQHQASNAGESPNPNCKVLLRYKRDFFKAFCSNWTRKKLQPARIPQNLEYLSIFTGSEIFLRKLIKQNKRLRHIEFVSGSLNEVTHSAVIGELKYCKNLCSISFIHCLPWNSDRVFHKLVKSFGNNLRKVRIAGNLDLYNREPEELRKVMENLFKLPKLQEFYFQPVSAMSVENFPGQKLQELQQARNVACSMKLRLTNSPQKSLLERLTGFESNDFLRINMKPAGEINWLKWSKMSLDKFKTQHLSCQQVRILGIPSERENHFPKLLEFFDKTPNLEIAIPSRYDYDVNYSGLAGLSNLKQFSFDIEHREAKISLKKLFRNLSENVEAHKKLESFFMRVPCYPGVADDEEDKSVVRFFNVCAETLRKAYFEFRFDKKESRELEPFYEGISKLEHLQSLNVLLSFHGYDLEDYKQAEEICQAIFKMDSLEELELKIDNKSDIQALDLKLPSQLKKLALRLQTLTASFDPPKAIWSLSSLVFLELEFHNLHLTALNRLLLEIDKLKKLEVLVLKEAQNMRQNDILLTKIKLDGMMKEHLNLKLVVFVRVVVQEIMVFKREYSWSKVNSVIDDLSFEEYLKVGFIKSYSGM